MSPAALSLLTVVFDEGKERNRALGLWAALAQFLAATGFTVDVDGSTCLVNGWGSPEDGQVCFHEKDDLGQDVRVWHVSQVDSGFMAEHVEAC